MLWNVPNTLTWIRIAAIPLIVLLFFMPYPWADPAAGLLFAAAGITDSLDGYLARRRQARRRCCPGPARQQGPSSPDRPHRSRHHRPRNHHIRLARMDGRNRP